MPSSVGEIRILKAGPAAIDLLDRLRPIAEGYAVVVDQPDDGSVLVTDLAGHVDDLPAFLRAQLDELDPEWGEHLAVSVPN